MDSVRRLICRIFGHDLSRMFSDENANSFCARCRRMFQRE